ncbi:LysR family transcriptional regulator [Halovibrio salipaludis]|uniref:LysR family transcriptional regulator n=1 Tax=Halovibrio salipaludis TaxID=2032626 RepID=A0A2A2FBK8_9GAMM|nr:LysR family transcriptional regulator [Halovibrio salipaludis]PAU82104.1 LysR family transcriptional regulator [Halovibrio salipaludis]
MSIFSQRMPTIKQLQCFVAVAQELNFRRAAERLNMSQPPLSRQIKRLESLLRIKLIERDTHTVSLTSAGEAFEHEAHAILSRIDTATSALRQKECGNEADVRLGLTSVIDFSQIPGIQAILTSDKRPVQIRTEYAYSKQLIKRLRSGEIDLAIVGNIPGQGEAFEVRPLASDPLMVALPESHNASQHEQVSFKDLAGTTLFWFPRNENPDFYDKCEQTFVDFGYEPPRKPEPTEHMTLLSKIAAGEGMAFFPASMRAASRLGVVYRPFVPEIEARLNVELKLMWRSSETRSEVLRTADRFIALGIPAGT